MSSREEILCEWKWTFWPWQRIIKDNRNWSYRPQNLISLCKIKLLSVRGETVLNCLLFYNEVSAVPCWVMERLVVPFLHCKKPQQSRCGSLYLHFSVSSLCFCDINMNKQALNVHFYDKHVISQRCACEASDYCCVTSVCVVLSQIILDLNMQIRVFIKRKHNKFVGTLVTASGLACWHEGICSRFSIRARCGC